MTKDAALEDLIREGRIGTFAPARIGGHDVLVETDPIGTSVYQIRGERVLTLRGNRGYREEIVAALLDAVDDLADADDLGSIVRLRPIEVPGFALDRAALLGPGHTDFFKNSPLADRGMQVIPVHRSEAVDGEEYATFWPGVIGRNLGIRQLDWTREPSPRADVRRLDDGEGGLYRRKGSRRSPKAGMVTAKTVLKHDLPGLLDGVRLSAMDVRGHDLRLHREFDRLRGTLHLPGGSEVVDVDIPRLSALAVFGPLFAGADFDAAALAAASASPPEDMLEMRVNDEGRRRYDSEAHPASLEECLEWLRALCPHDGNFLVFCGRSGGCVQMMWQSKPESQEPRLWLETPELEHRRSRGRHVTLDEAERMITVLAREDRVAVDDLGDLEHVPF
ncbi:hypothetical protein [Actinoallomurus iriomotensis]|uniref:Uncharacterized protein n=1 Tax=Actinoallomurus iriomotensis TaxID=478107 RepID=A0A9W6SDY6_9ACTN|nr:hypothetical protein [Actinoallomurus iriomotensis]GLY90962.1 hypothetical protein Airi02_088910 [Actinoallomurus iriomotensis]